ncbi:MAG TPA: SDR family oxidoreductase [Ilumatobacter sp.]|nr:SDR family oxidoreductase [Ilumatobacter sp.]
MDKTSIRLDGGSAISDSDVAVVGMAGRFAGAPDVDELWRRVHAGDDCLTDLDPGELRRQGVPAAVIDDASYVLRTGPLDDVEGFDHRFFGIGARDAAVMDPQHRHFLEVAWEALESAAIVPERFDGAIGVFGGCGMDTYLLNNLITNPKLVEQIGWFLLRHTGNDKDFLTNNVAYRLDLRGPAVNVQTACSTSLVAVHLAVQSLLAFETDVALAGGATIEVPHRRGYTYHEGEILAPDGVCRAFDADSAGTVLTSGVAVVALRRLGDALADGDPVLAVIKGTAINNDGSRKVGFLAPSVDAHADVIREALTVAGLSARDLQLFEAHGTGTAVGDPIEVAAASAAFRSWTDDRGFCRITSTKPNIGHTDTAAGAASLIKVVQAMQHRTLPPLANHTAPSPLLDIDRTPFVVSGEAVPWPGAAPRRAGVSSLGVGGTNAHVIVEEAPAEQPVEPPPPEQVLALSGMTPAAVDAAAVRLADHLDAHPDADLAAVAHTLVAGRRAMPHRRVVTATDAAAAARVLRSGDRFRSSNGAVPEGTARLGFMFPGGGSQYAGMAAGLDARFAEFHAVRGEAIALVRAAGGVDLAPLLAAGGDPDALRPPTASLPAVFVTSVALARQWIAFGAQPDLLLGHSLGEYTAAHLAGVMSLEDAVRLVVVRSALMERASGTDAAMLVVPLAEAELAGMLPRDLSLAVVNGADECVVAGRRPAIEAFAAELAARDTPGSIIPLSAAAHSALLDPVLPEFAAVVGTVDLQPPRLPYLSNLTGTWVTAEQATDPQYWVDHLRGTVRFADCLRTALAGQQVVLSELGPGQTLSSLARRSDPSPVAAIPTLRHADHDIADAAFTAHAFARQWAAGADVDLGALVDERRRRVRLPTYPFQHERCWIEPGVTATYAAAATATAASEAGTAQADALQRINDVDQATWAVEWSPVAEPVGGAATAGAWYVVADADDELARSLAAELAQRGAGSVVVAEQPPAPTDDLAGVVLVAPTGRDAYHLAVARWFGDGTEAARRLGGGAGSARLAAVTRSAFPADGAAERPADAMVLGLVTVAANEYPTLTTRLVDVEAGPISAAAGTSAAATIVDDILGDGPQVVAHRAGSRLAPVVEQVVAAPPGAGLPTFRDGGTYVVTGGLGGVGHVLAMHLADAHRANVVLVASASVPEGEARSRWLATHSYDDPTSRRIRQLTDVEQFGTKVTVVVADLADPRSVRRALDEAEQQAGVIDGVIHAAGQLRDGLIELATPAEHQLVLGAKAHGALVLAAELERRQADLLLLISSTSTTLAAPGQASYVGANAVLDALAGRRGGLRIATINFGLWSGVGIASELGRRRRLGLADGEPIVHPVFSELHRAADGSVSLVGRVDAQAHWVVNEHRTAAGAAVYPGSGHVQLMLSAAELAGLAGVVLADVALLTPLVVPDGSPVTVRAVVSADGRVEISSDGATGRHWSLHSEAVVRPAGGDAADVIADDVAAEFARLPLVVDDLLGRQRDHVSFGPRWDSLVEARRGDRVVIARLALPGDDEAEARRWSPHPALIDVATAAGFALVAPRTDAGLYVPTNYARVHAIGPVPGNLYVRATEAAGSTPDRPRFDLVGVDLHGELVFTVCGLEFLYATGSSVLAATEPPPAQPAAVSGAADLTDLADAFGLRPDEGADLVERLVAGTRDRLIGSTIDLAMLRHAVVGGHDEPRADTPAAGSASLETALIAIWGDLLGSDAISIDDDFFDLGGHSLIAIRLMARIQAEVGVRLQLSTIFDAPTIALLSSRLRAEDPTVDQRFAAAPPDGSPSSAVAVAAPPAQRHLVPISTSGAGRPLYVVHGAGGNVLFLGSFGRALGERPVYGFQAHGVDADERPDDTFAAMADRYVAELRAHAPGPYLLGGYSGGGLVALEMARRLQADGEQVDVVVLFDSPVGRISLGRTVHARHLLRNLFTKGPAPIVPIVTSRLQGTRLGRRLFFRGRQSLHERSHEANYADMLGHGFHNLFDHFTEVAERTQAGVYDIDAILVKAQLRWPLMSDDYGWTPHVRGRLQAIVAPGDHESMFHGDNVGALVTELAPLLDEYDR